MTAYDIILRKRNGQPLSREQIEFMILEFTRGNVRDYQMAAFLMAVYFRGLDADELAHLTHAMLLSGKQIDLSSVKGTKLDKHSSGGVGDKTSLIVLPIVAACGVKVAKMSGRGLGHTGGTLDKLESIPGFRVKLDEREYVESIDKHGLVICGQTDALVPADRLMYELRDVTATVDSIPLIASSIMCKKLAGGADAIVLDVKCGSGAFMQEQQHALELARTMVNIGSEMSKPVVALVTDMGQPLGRAVGNALEVSEAVQVLKGDGPDDLVDLCLAIAAEMVSLGTGEAVARARSRCEQTLVDGSALDKFRALVQAQGGDECVAEMPEHVLAIADSRVQIGAQEEGYVADVDALTVGRAVMALGAGRTQKDERIDHSCGVLVHKKVGDRLKTGEPLFTVLCDHPERTQEAVRLLATAVRVCSAHVDRRPLLLYRVTRDSTQRLT